MASTKIESEILEGADGLNIQSSIVNEDKVTFNEWIDNVRKLRNEATDKKYLHLAIHFHKYGQSNYSFFSHSINHFGEEDLQDRLIALFKIDFEPENDETIEYEFNIEAPTLK